MEAKVDAQRHLEMAEAALNAANDQEYGREEVSNMWAQRSIAHSLLAIGTVLNRGAIWTRDGDAI